MSPRWTRALVTGASSGIGREMARILGSEGTDLVVVARDRARLEEVAAELPVRVEVLVADLSTTAGVGAVAERLDDDDDPIDLLVNNAGLGFTGDLIDLPADRRQRIIDVNVTALHELCATGGAAMVRRGGGTILNVSSVAGDLPSAQSATYNATKAFVSSLSESLHLELAPKNVTVSCLCPGLTRTEFQERAEFDSSELPDALWQTAGQVAAVGLDGAASGKVIFVSGIMNKAASRLARSAPRALTRWGSGKLSDR